MRKLIDLVAGDIRGISGEKIAGLSLGRGGPPLPPLPAGKRQWWLEHKYVWKLGRSGSHVACPVTSVSLWSKREFCPWGWVKVSIEGWKGAVCGVEGKASQGQIQRLCTELMTLLKLKAIIWNGIKPGSSRIFPASADIYWALFSLLQMQKWTPWSSWAQKLTVKKETDSKQVINK